MLSQYTSCSTCAFCGQHSQRVQGSARHVLYAGMQQVTGKQKLMTNACLLPLLLAHLLDVQIPADDTEHVQVLSLVLMDTLDLDIIQGIGGHFSACDFLHIATKTVSSLLYGNAA